MNTPEKISEKSGDSERRTGQVCTGCPQADQCREVWSIPRRGPFTPTGLSLSSALVFLLPLVTAIIAGVIFQARMTAEKGINFWGFMVVGIGFLAGVFMAWLIMPFMKKHFHQDKHCQSEEYPVEEQIHGS